MRAPFAAAIDERRERAELGLLLVGLAAIGPFSLNVFKPCLPWIRIDLAAPVEVVQLGLSLSILASALATIGFCGSADRWGRRPVVVASLAMYVGGSLVAAVAPSAPLLIVGRVVQAAASSIGLATARTLLHDRYGAGRSAPMIARVTFIALLAVLLAPAFGGALIDRAGWRAVFATSALIGIVLLLMARQQLDEDPARSRETSRQPRVVRDVGRLLASRVFLGFALQSSLHFAVFFAFTSAAAYIMVDQLHRSATAYGSWFVGMAAMTGAGLLSARALAERVPAGVLASAGSLVVCAASLVGAFTLTRPELTPAGLFLPPSFGSFGIGLALPATNAGVMEVDPRRAGTASGLLSFMQMVLAALFAQLVVTGGTGWPPVILALLVLVGGVGSFAASLLSTRYGVDRREGAR